MPVPVSGFSVTLSGRVRETTQTTGTGTYSLDGAPTGKVTFLEGIGTGNHTIYTVESGANYETGIGLVSSGTPATLSRALVLESSNSNNAVNWGSGIKDVFVDAAATLLEQIWARPNALPAMFVDSRPRQTAAGATFYEFTSISSDIRQIVVTVSNWRVGTGGATSALLLQIGTSGSYIGAGYAAQCAGINSSLGVGHLATANGFPITVGGGSNIDTYGSAIITRHGSVNDFWVYQSVVSNGVSVLYGGGAVNLGGAATRVRLIAANGTDTFSLGTIGCQLVYGTA